MVGCNTVIQSFKKVEIDLPGYYSQSSDSIVGIVNELK